MTRLILFISLAFLSFGSYATHIVGGELYYKCVGNNNYEITLKVYRDCAGTGAPFDPTARIGVFRSSNNSLYTVLSLTFPGSTQLTIPNPNGCLTLPPALCIEEAVYVDTFNLPPIAGGYTLAYQRCCRNPTILNIVSPGSTGSTYVAKIPDSAIACNSSAYFKNFPPIVLCKGDILSFDHSAIDIDNDSLVYSLVTPYAGASSASPNPNPPSNPPYSNIIWGTGYNTAYQVSSTPAIVINSSTGLITGSPNLVGQFVVGVSVKEYRNGVVIAETRRDFQFNIVNCNKSVSSVMQQTIQCDGFTVQFQSNSVNTTSYFWDFGELTKTNDTSNIQNPTYTYTDTGKHVVMLIANPGSKCADTSYSTFYIYPKITPLYNKPNDQCLDGNMFNFFGLGNYEPTTSFSWDFGAGANPATSTSLNQSGVVYSTSGWKVVKLTYTDFTCVKTYTDSFYVVKNSNAGTILPLSFCNGKAMSFQNNTTNANTYFWNFGDLSSLSDTSNLSNPTYNYTNTGTHTVMFIADPGSICADTTYLTIDVKPKLVAYFQRPMDECLNGNSFNFNSGGTFFPTTQFLWNFGAGALPNNSNQQNPSGISYDTTGSFPVSLTISDFGCQETYTDTVKVYSNPELNFQLGKTEGCPVLGVQFYDSSSSQTPLSYLWSFGDGTYSSEAEPFHNYTESGFYDVSITIMTTNGCIDTVSAFLPNAIHVYPVPTAGFSFTPDEVWEWEPYITFFDESKDNISCELFAGDGTTYLVCATIEHTYQDTGWVYPMQVVVNDYGCTDTLVKKVFVRPEFTFYPPNTFTPDGDGLNDIWWPRVYAAKEYELYVFDRWGHIVFETTSTEVGWNGVVKGGSEVAPTGVYQYLAKCWDRNGREYQYVGNVHLLK